MKFEPELKINSGDYQVKKIQMLDLSPEVKLLWDKINKAIQEVVLSGQFILGPNVKAFEQEAANYLGVKHAVGVNSGTDALVISLRAAGIGPGDEVITTPFTFFATAESISRVGAIPVFIDIDPKTFNLDPGLIENAVTTRTKAVLPVHLYGHAADMKAILAQAEKYRLVVVEDVAQAFGAEFKGKKLGAAGNAGCYSFFPSKVLGAFGDGGLIATNDDHMAETARMLRAHGSTKRYYHEVIGYNSRLDEIQAAVLRVKLPELERSNEKRRQVARRYNDLLDDIPGITTPYEAPCAKHVYHQYTVRISDGKRDSVQKYLAGQGIETRVHYPVPLHKLPVYRGNRLILSKVEQAATEVLSLPIWPDMENELQDYIADMIKFAINL
ncbi:MAG: UDP-2-acetamido-2-deoxy-3-oxo-D-glucuronate aminotransferase [Pelotomaculum sp. PtaB.Bin013]|nr:MAG: UDP-2-acetamido-2-deoxy-3-oxo-D-glucuronate aminotransferase [Pelotomaculum sp. PtaB.Bin013]